MQTSTKSLIKEPKNEGGLTNRRDFKIIWHHPIHFRAEETEGDLSFGFLSPLSQVRCRWSLLCQAGNLCLADTPND